MCVHTRVTRISVECQFACGVASLHNRPPLTCVWGCLLISLYMAYTHIKAHTATSPRRAANTMALVSKSSLACIFAPRVHARGVFATRAPKNLEQKISSSTRVRVRAGKHLVAPPNIDAPYASAADSIAAAASNHATSLLTIFRGFGRTLLLNICDYQVPSLSIQNTEKRLLFTNVLIYSLPDTLVNMS